MKIRQSFEQAICILLLISKSEGPLKSHDLSEKLHVSDSYLKKITRQLVVSGLITSKASKLGGFVLNKDPKDISFLDIFNAIEGKEHFIETTHLVEKVLPAIGEGKIVLCDRFVDSSLVYQGIARGIGIEEVYAINQFAIEGHLPDATIFLSVDFETGLSRVHSRGNQDRLDNESMEFHKMVAEGYEIIKERFHERMHVIDANNDIETVLQHTVDCVLEIIKDYV